MERGVLSSKFTTRHIVPLSSPFLLLPVFHTYPPPWLSLLYLPPSLFPIPLNFYLYLLVSFPLFSSSLISSSSDPLLPYNIFTLVPYLFYFFYISYTYFRVCFLFSHSFFLSLFSSQLYLFLYFSFIHLMYFSVLYFVSFTHLVQKHIIHIPQTAT
jgi:hypothetical protein